MRPLATLTLAEIRKLFKTYLGFKSISRSMIYYYVHTRDFPQNTGFGRPRLWNKTKVMAWFKKQR